MNDSHDLDSVIKPDKDFYNEHFQREDFSLRNSENFKSYTWYLKFVFKHQEKYDYVIGKLTNEGASEKKISEGKERYQNVLNQYLHPAATLLHENPVDKILRNNLPDLSSLDDLLKESPLVKAKGADLYRIKFDNLIIEGITEEEVKTTCENFKTSFRYLAESNPEVEVALRQRLHEFRKGGPDADRPIQTCIRKGSDDLLISRWHIQDRLVDYKQYHNKRLYPDNMQIVQWSQETVAIDGENQDAGRSISSPAVGLVHELEHAFFGLYDPIGQLARLFIADEKFHNMEEKQVICDMEAQLQIALGLIPRVSHHGWGFMTNEVTSHELALKIREGDEVKRAPVNEMTGSLTREGAKPGEIGIKIKEENGETDRTVFFDQGEIAKLMEMDPDLDIQRKIVRDGVLNEAIEYGDTVTLHKKNGLPTIKNLPQEHRLRFKIELERARAAQARAKAELERRVNELMLRARRYGAEINASDWVSLFKEVMAAYASDRDKRIRSAQDLQMEAAKQGRVDVIMELVDAGADQRATDSERQNALMLVVKNVRDDLKTEQWATFFNSAIAKGVGIEERYERNETLLMAAAKRGLGNACMGLVNAGADLIAKDDGGQNALALLVTNVRDDLDAKQWAAFIKKAVDKGANLDEQYAILVNQKKDRWNTIFSMQEETLLLTAARRGLGNACIALIDARADLRVTDKEGQNALMLLVKNVRDDLEGAQWTALFDKAIGNGAGLEGRDGALTQALLQAATERGLVNACTALVNIKRTGQRSEISEEPTPAVLDSMEQWIAATLTGIEFKGYDPKPAEIKELADRFVKQYGKDHNLQTRNPKGESVSVFHMGANIEEARDGGAIKPGEAFYIDPKGNAYVFEIPDLMMFKNKAQVKVITPEQQEKMGIKIVRGRTEEMKIGMKQGQGKQQESSSSRTDSKGFKR